MEQKSKISHLLRATASRQNKSESSCFYTAVQVALLTIYDMCKAVDRGMTITDVKLLEKHGGKSGTYIAEK